MPSSVTLRVLAVAALSVLVALIASLPGPGRETRPAGAGPAFPTDPDLAYFAGDAGADTRVSIEGEKFKVNGSFLYPGRVWNGNSVEGLLVNARMVNGIYDDLDGSPPPGMLPWDARSNTQDFIGEMPSWKEQGLAAFTIDLQGGSNRCNNVADNFQSLVVDNNPYSPNGTKAFDDWYTNTDTAHARYLARLGSIIRAADDNGLAVILGLFYFGQDEDLQNETAVRAAVDKATDWVLANGWTNVLIEIVNEADIHYEHDILRPGRVHELMQRVTARSSGAAGAHLPHGRLLVSASESSGRIPSNTWLQNSDFVLLHSNFTNASGVGSMVSSTRARSAFQAEPQPIAFNEDSTDLSKFQAALSARAGWGYHDSDGYQCVYADSVPDRWALSKATNADYWPMVADVASGVAPPPPPPGAVVMEAEDMSLTNYVVDGSNSDVIMVNFGASTGQALGTFAGPDGTYRIDVEAVAENDGQPTLEIWIDGARRATFVYPLGTSSRQPVTFTVPPLFIRSGAPIRLVGTMAVSGAGMAHARVDALTFTPGQAGGDTDGDGCADARELGPNEAEGGRRDPQNFWDFFDTPDAANVRDHVISASDLFRIARRFGASGTATSVADALSPPHAAGYHAAFDRGAPLPGGEPWDLRPADGAIGAADLAVAIPQFGHSCQ